MTRQGQRWKTPTINKKKSQPGGLSHLIGINHSSYEAEPAKMAAPSLSPAWPWCGIGLRPLAAGCFWVSRWHEAFHLPLLWIPRRNNSLQGREALLVNALIPEEQLPFHAGHSSAAVLASLGRKPGDIFSAVSSRRQTCDNYKNWKSLSSINI